MNASFARNLRTTDRGWGARRKTPSRRYAVGRYHVEMATVEQIRSCFGILEQHVAGICGRGLPIKAD